MNKEQQISRYCLCRSATTYGKLLMTNQFRRKLQRIIKFLQFHQNYENHVPSSHHNSHAMLPTRNVVLKQPAAYMVTTYSDLPAYRYTLFPYTLHHLVGARDSIIVATMQLYCSLAVTEQRFGQTCQQICGSCNNRNTKFRSQHKHASRKR